MTDQHFAKACRLREPREFKQVFDQGDRLIDRNFVIISTPNTARHPRLGLAISKRRAKRAVDRNRIKRVIRESFRQQAVTLPDRDIVVLARHATVTSTNQQLFASLLRHWQAMGRQTQGTSDHG